MPATENEPDPQVEAPPSAIAPDRAAIKRRRRWLFLFAGLALIAVAGFAALQLFGKDNKNKDATTNGVPAPLILERFDLKPVGGQSGRGLAELVHRPGGDGLRVLAAKLRPTLDGQVYQLLLSGGTSPPKLLGNEKVNSNKTFVGEAKVSAEELHKYTSIVLNRVTTGSPPISRGVLKGSIPR
jgi:hypothetical protein